MPGRRFASMDCLAGRPISKRLCPPAAAISRARRAASWPRTSSKVGHGPGAFPQRGGRGGAERLFPVRCRTTWAAVAAPYEGPPPLRPRAAFSVGTDSSPHRSPQPPAPWAECQPPAAAPRPARARPQRPARCLPGQLPACTQQSQQHRQIIHRAGLAHIGRGQVHRDAAGRPGVAQVFARCAPGRRPLSRRCPAGPSMASCGSPPLMSASAVTVKPASPFTPKAVYLCEHGPCLPAFKN